MDRVLQQHRPSFLYHAAAFKHVPMLENHIFAAVENNIFGTWQVTRASARHRVEHFVMISTDKAVQPTSMMGATKRMAELAIRALQRDCATRFITVRFGNLLGSSGSIIAIFKRQIDAGGPVTVHMINRRLPHGTQIASPVSQPADADSRPWPHLGLASVCLAAQSRPSTNRSRRNDRETQGARRGHQRPLHSAP